MRTRNVIKNEDGTYNIVWFGSVGVTKQDEIVEEVAVYSITRENFLCNEFPIAVCGITSVTYDDAENPSYITSITIKSTYKRSKNQIANFKVDGIGSIKYLFQEVDENDTVVSNLFSGYIDNNIDINMAFTMSDTNYILLTLSELDGTNTKINELSLQYLPKAGLKIGANNYIINNQEMVAKSLIPRLSILKNELYYNLNYGLSLLDKIRDKAIIDMEIIDIINNHPAVVKINNFNSNINNKTRTYAFTADILTVYNESTTISLDYSI